MDDQDELVSMDPEELRKVTDEIVRYVIDQGRVKGDDAEDWFGKLVVEVMMEADERGYDNASEVGHEVEVLYEDKAESMWQSSRKGSG